MASSSSSASQDQPIGPSFGVPMPPDTTPSAIARWFASRPAHVVNSDSRSLEVDVSQLGFVHEGGEVANFLVVGHVAAAYLRTVPNPGNQWGLTLSRPGVECDFERGLDTLRTKIESLLPEGSTVELTVRNAGTNVRFARRYRDFPEDHPHFPEVRDFTNGGDMNNAPPLDDITKISTRSVVAAAFTAKLWDRRDFEMQSSESGAPTTPTAAASSPSPKRGKGKGKSKAVPGQASEPLRLNARLELVCVWYFGRDEDAAGSQDRSPTKVPRF